MRYTRASAPCRCTASSIIFSATNFEAAYPVPLADSKSGSGDSGTGEEEGAKSRATEMDDMNAKLAGLPRRERDKVRRFWRPLSAGPNEGRAREKLTGQAGWMMWVTVAWRLAYLAGGRPR